MKLLGVIEGFYGRPWTQEQRLRLFERMQGWGMNTYLYAPKDDRWHRQHWREPYPQAEAERLARLNAEATACGIQFVYALSPGLNLDWSQATDRQALTHKFQDMAALGIQHFALLFDDIPYAADRAAQAEVQVAATHAVMSQLWPDGQSGLMLFCPTEYCGERAQPSVAGSPYLHTLGQSLSQDVQIVWTGPAVVSVELELAGIQEINRVLQRQVLLWDNLHASDYTLHRLHLGPYAGRPLALRDELAGILSNPNTPLEPNTPGLVSLASYARAKAIDNWTPETSLEEAITAWLPEFSQTQGVAVSPEDLRLLVDLLYLPGQLGPRARSLLQTAQALLDGTTVAEAAQAELRRACESLLNILNSLETGPNRDLLFDLHPYIVDAISELQRLMALASGKAVEGQWRGSLATRLMEMTAGYRLAQAVD